MITQKWHRFNSTEHKQLQKIISEIFSNQYIYVNKSFRKQIFANKKGYIHCKQLIKQASLQEYFQEQNVRQLKEKMMMTLREAEKCSQLMVISNKIRRVCPFNFQIYKDVKPIFIQEQQRFSISQIRQYLGGQCFAGNQSKQDNDNLTLLYAPKYRQIIKSQDIPFKIVNYQKLCHERERQSRFWYNHQNNIYKEISPIKNYDEHLRYLSTNKMNFDRMNKKNRQLQEYKNREMRLKKGLVQLDDNDNDDANNNNDEMRDQQFDQESQNYKAQVFQSRKKILDFCIIKKPNPQFNKFLIKLIKEKHQFMERQ